MNLQRSSIWLWECHTTSTSPCYGLHSSELLLPPSPAGMISYRRTGLFVFQFFMAGFNHLIQVFSYLLPCFVSFSATFSLCRNYSIFHLQNEQNAVGSHFLKHHFPPWDYLDWGKNGVLHSRREQSAWTLPFLLPFFPCQTQICASGSVWSHLGSLSLPCGVNCYGKSSPFD